MMQRRSAAALTAGLVACLVGAGCTSASSPSTGGGSTTSASSATPTGADNYLNPVFGSDFPDPSVLRVGATYFGYATQGGGKNIQTLRSGDLVHWQAGPDALPEVGAWASAGNTWAPEVMAIGSRFAMYYVAHDDTSGKQCIGRAESAGPSGPFRDTARTPLVCQAELGGSIDPDPIRTADGLLYLYWKNDGNCCDLPVHLWGQRLNADGTALIGKPVALLTNSKSWQGNLVEAPEMVSHRRHYTLFYSANDYASSDYGIGYANCHGPLGPCTDASDASLIASNEVAAGPGHCFVLQLPSGQWWMLYHAWPPNAVGSQSPGRLLWLEPITWNGEAPTVHPSDASPQHAPLTGS